MGQLPKIASLWIGERLSFLEQLCIQSFLDHGHKVTLYIYEEVAGIPAGVEVKDARPILAGPPFRVHHLHASPAIHADVFRVNLMMHGGGEIWADTDAYCHKPFAFEAPHVYGWLDEQVANGVMRLPADSPALKAYHEFLHVPEPDPVFLPLPLRQQTLQRRAAGENVALEDLPWGASGPMALTYFLRQTGEDRYALPEKVFYPLNWQHRRAFLLAPRRFNRLMREETVSIHFLGRIVRRILRQEFNGLPKPGSILDVLCKAHDIDPQAAPIPPKE